MNFFKDDKMRCPIHTSLEMVEERPGLFVCPKKECTYARYVYATSKRDID